jgi:hypothetical protein
MVEQLEAIFDRLDRAQEHLEAIKPELLAYYNSDPCHLTGKFEPDEEGIGATGEWSGELGAFGVRLNTLIGEFLHDARSSLDHLAWQLVLRNCGEPTLDTSFPICHVAPNANKKGEASMPNVAGGASHVARTVIHEAQPYQWGEGYANHPLWVLHQLWNIDKHRHVIARGAYLQARFTGDIPVFTYTSRFESADEYEAKLILVPDDPAMDVDAHATLKVTIEEPEFGIELQLLGALEEILKRVLGVITTAEDRCF